MGALGAVRAATAVNAQIIGRGDDIGTIAEGYLADASTAFV